MLEGWFSCSTGGQRVVGKEGGALTAQVCLSCPVTEYFGLQPAPVQNTNLVGDVIGLLDGCCHGNPPSDISLVGGRRTLVRMGSVITGRT